MLRSFTVIKPRHFSSSLPLSQFILKTSFTASHPFSTTRTTNMSVPNFFDLKAQNKKHEEISMKTFENKVILVVNVASKCGFTSQYAGLQELYAKYKDRGFVILGFPCNQFGGQEPGTEEEITSFCQVNFGVEFPIMAKIDVNGDKEDPVYTFLKSQKAGLLGLQRIKWNFEKFLINKEGKVVKRYSSVTTPSAIGEDVEKLL